MLCTADRVKAEFRRYKLIKTDMLARRKVGIQLGADGVTYDAFEKQLDRHAANISARIAANRYFFAPFRELLVSKDYTLKLSTARKKDRTRTLSIACLRDVMVQRLLHQAVAPFVESSFSATALLDKASFAYRAGKSAPAAARLTHQYIQRGYLYILDADVRKFFDEIPHGPLMELIDKVFAPNVVVSSLLKRFVKADRVAWESYRGDETRFYTERAKRVRRDKGIPQGGVLSGLVANLYLHSFDRWVLEELGRHHDIKYVRYADDFVIMAREPNIRDAVKPLVKDKLAELGLELHTDPEKTKLLDLSMKATGLDFVGFRLSSTGIRVKPTNVGKFKRRFTEKLWETIKSKYEVSPESALRFMIQHKLQYKILGNWAADIEKCAACGKPMALRSWVAFFATITDVQQLRALDRWIRKMIHAYFLKSYGVRVGAREMKAAGLVRLERVYYDIRRQLGSLDLCKCPTWESKEARIRAVDDTHAFLPDLSDDIS